MEVAGKQILNLNGRSDGLVGDLFPVNPFASNRGQEIKNYVACFPGKFTEGTMACILGPGGAGTGSGGNHVELFEGDIGYAVRRRHLFGWPSWSTIVRERPALSTMAMAPSLESAKIVATVIGQGQWRTAMAAAARNGTPAPDQPPPGTGAGAWPREQVRWRTLREGMRRDSGRGFPRYLGYCWR